MTSYDVIVLGLGAMGSATAYHLARRGRRVLGLDAHPRGHTLGSSHGRSRIIREAYFEAPEYVPLVQRAETLWRELEALTGRSLLRQTGGLNIGPAAGELVRGALASARQHGLPYELLESSAIRRRFPAFELPDDLVGVFEPHAGILDAEACVAAHLDQAIHHGAELHHSESAQRWRADGSGVVVETTAGRYRAERLVITAGPWAAEVLGDFDLPLSVERMLNIYVEPAQPAIFDPSVCPVYLLELPEGFYYGFPTLPGDGVKFGRHDLGERCTAASARREVCNSEVAAFRGVLARYLPAANGPLIRTSTCLYTNTPDRNFIVDLHPAHPQVVYACGFSGHGFKFSSALGEVLADLALEGARRPDVAFLSAARFGVAAVG